MLINLVQIRLLLSSKGSVRSHWDRKICWWLLVQQNPWMVMKDFVHVCGIGELDVVSHLINVNSIKAGNEAEFLNFNCHLGVDSLNAGF